MFSIVTLDWAWQVTPNMFHLQSLLPVPDNPGSSLLLRRVDVAILQRQPAQVRIIIIPLSSCLWCAQVLRHKRLRSWPQLSPRARRVTAPHRGLDKPRAWAGLQQVRVRIRVRIESDECHNKCPGLWLLPAVVAASLLLNAVLTVYQTISTGKLRRGKLQDLHLTSQTYLRS